MAMEGTQANTRTAGLTGLQKFAVGAFAILLTGSIVARATMSPESTGAPASASALTAMPPEGSASGSQGQGLEQYLPYVTEASFFGLIGFALGYTTRKVFKVLLVLIALAFLGTQAGVQAGWFEVNWDGVLAKLNDWVFNLKENATVTDFMTDRVPSAAGLLVGWVVGFKRG